MKNTDTKAIVTLGDLGAGFTQSADGKINVQAAPGITASYLAGGDAFTGKVQFKDTSSNNLLFELNATNTYDTTGAYVGTVLNFALPALAASLIKPGCPNLTRGERVICPSLTRGERVSCNTNK